MNEPPSDREVVNTRVLNAPREKVFKAWKEARHLSEWWGPKDFKNTFHLFEPKPGGNWRFTMHGPDGTDYPNECVFEVLRPDKIDLNHISPPHYFRLTVMLEEQGGKTKLVWRQRFETKEHCDRVREFVHRANEQNLDRLEAELATMA